MVYKLYAEQAKEIAGTVFPNFSQFWKWIICPSRHILVDSGGYCAIVEDTFTVDKDGKRSVEIIWTNGIPCKRLHDWSDCLAGLGFQVVVYGSHLKYPVPIGMQTSWAGVAFVYMQNWSYSPMHLTFNH